MSGAGPAPLALPLDAGALQAGIAYALRHAPGAAGRRPLAPAGLRRLAAEVAAEMALRRWLANQAIPHTLVEDAPFTRPGRPRPVVGGRRLIQHTLVRLRRSRPATDPSPGAEAAAGLGLPAAALDLERFEPGEVLLFALLVAGPQDPRDPARGCRVAIPADPRWRDLPASGLRLLLRGPAPLDLVVHGLTADRRPCREPIRLTPDGQAVPAADLTRLRLLEIDRPARGTLVAAVRPRGPRWTVSPGDWASLALEAPAMLALGWLTVGEAIQAARPWRPDRPSTTLAFARAPARLLPLRQLRPLADLAARARHG